MRKLIVISVWLILALLAPLASAQSSPAIHVSPFPPREDRAVTISITEDECRNSIGITRTGNAFVIAFVPGAECIAVRPYRTTEFQVGSLPPGNYSVTFVRTGPSSPVYATATFAVTASQSIPALGWRSLLLLAAALAWGAVLALRAA